MQNMNDFLMDFLMDFWDILDQFWYKNRFNLYDQFWLAFWWLEFAARGRRGGGEEAARRPPPSPPRAAP